MMLVFLDNAPIQKKSLFKKHQQKLYQEKHHQITVSEIIGYINTLNLNIREYRGFYLVLPSGFMVFYPGENM